MQIFKLNCFFEEIDCISVCYFRENIGIASGVSHYCKDDQLLVSTTNGIIFVCKNGSTPKVIQRACCTGSLNSAICVEPYLFYIDNANSKFTLNRASCDGEVVEREYLPPGYKPETAMLYPSRDKDGYCHIYVLACKHNCYSYVLDIILDDCLFDKEGNKEDCENFRGEGLKDFREDCSRRCCNDCCDRCKGNCSNDCCDRCKGNCGNEWWGSRHKNDCKGGVCRCQQSCCNNGCNCIMESIALQETALAHILNAEGEKLQKAIKNNTNTCELLKVNESIQKTIVHVTHQEHVLYSKLETLKDFCEFCNKSPHVHQAPCKNSPKINSCEAEEEAGD